MHTLAERRDRSKRLATHIVSFAIMALGVAFLILAVVLPLRGGAGFIFLAILLGGAGLAAVLGGFFFHLVPFRLEALEAEKREYDQRQRDEARKKEKRVRGDR